MFLPGYFWHTKSSSFRRRDVWLYFPCLLLPPHQQNNCCLQQGAKRFCWLYLSNAFFFFFPPKNLQWFILHVCYLATTWNPAILVNDAGRFSQCPRYIDRCCLTHCYFSWFNHIGQVPGWTCGHGWAWTGSSTMRKPVATCTMHLSRLSLLLDWLKHNRSCSKCNWGVFRQWQYESPLAY